MPMKLYLLLFVGLCLAGCTAELSETPSDVSAGNDASAEVGEFQGVLELTKESFQHDVLENSKVVLVDCWAPWCGPCLQQSPIIDEIAEDFHGRAVVAKLNIDDAMSVAREYNISSIPALLFFKDGQVADMMVGLQSKNNIVATLENLIDDAR